MSQQPGTDKQTTATMIIGAPGCGKSTLSNEMIRAEIRKGGRALVITPDAMDWPGVFQVHPRHPERLKVYRGVRKMIYTGPETLEMIYQHFSGGLLIFDDMKAYTESGVNKLFRRILIRRRHMDTDQVFIAHSFNEMPPVCFTYCTHLALFETEDNPLRHKEKLLDPDAMAAMARRVNHAALSDRHYKEIIRLRR